jgi:hypothetical protein
MATAGNVAVTVGMVTGVVTATCNDPKVYPPPSDPAVPASGAHRYRSFSDLTGQHFMNGARLCSGRRGVHWDYLVRAALPGFKNNLRPLSKSGFAERLRV